MLVTFFHSEDVTPMKSGDFVCWVFLVVVVGHSVYLGGGFLSFICSFKGNSFELLEAALS